MEQTKPDEVEIYVPHDGTIKISGATIPKRAGKCAYHFLERGLPIIDFFCIGANANQQAMKSMGVFLHMTKKYMQVEVSFQPLRYLVQITNKVTNAIEIKDSVVWRVVILDR